MLDGTGPSLCELRIPCAICGGKSSGFHYGIHACEGCKGFFRRTNRLKLTYKTCHDACLVNVKTRNRCQYCRYEKCISAGMSHSAIRYGRISEREKQMLATRFSGENYPAIPRLFAKPAPNPDVFRLIQSISSSFQLHIRTTKRNMDKIWSLLNSDQLPCHHIDSLHDIQMIYPWQHTPWVRYRNSITDSAGNEDVRSHSCGILPEMQYSQNELDKLLAVAQKNSLHQSRESLPVDKTCMPTYVTYRSGDYYRSISALCHNRATNDFSFNGFAMSEASATEESSNSHWVPANLTIDPNELFFARIMQFRIADAISEILYFWKSITGFRDLPIPDQVILLKYGSCEAAFLLLCTCLREQGMLLPGAKLFFTTKVLESTVLLYSIMTPKLELARKIAALNLSDKEMALYTAVILLNSDWPSLSSVKQVDSMRAALLEALEAAIDDAGHGQVQIFAKLLHGIADLKQIVFEHTKVIKTEGLMNISTPSGDEMGLFDSYL